MHPDLPSIALLRFVVVGGGPLYGAGGSVLTRLLCLGILVIVPSMTGRVVLVSGLQHARETAEALSGEAHVHDSLGPMLSDLFLMSICTNLSKFIGELTKR